ncbi:hypothetical protein LGH70_23225 [Hymenobacter sp. BT635]|uniref:DUF551 domain-containing protein n=1 Tax=Hymenobacter nitidus TaxID=2880929 RepID=A0ABS8AMT9_9BACT|nr:hypothetical protein [Hymenobacter nitidus]MCB2380525.1 hypothetical protein [Hymenobacter nitidus]
MRKLAQVPQPASVVVRLIMHDDGANGVYLFMFDKLEDGPSSGDEWFETVAEAAAADKYHVTAADWQPIPDPLEHCQQDWIALVRVKGRKVIRNGGSLKSFLLDNG